MDQDIPTAALQVGSFLLQERKIKLNGTYYDEQCLQYGSFMHNLQRPAAEGLYWSFFVINLLILFAASWRFGRVVERTEGVAMGNPDREARIHKCWIMAITAGFISLLIAVMECFALLTLQFCDQEPLSSLYWSTWTVLQVGAVVAIFGIALHTRHMIKGRKNPPWALALGTPVLVVAGLGHYFQGTIKRRAGELAARSRSQSRHSRGRSRVKDEALSETPTIRGESRDTEKDAEAADEVSRTIFGDSSDKFNAKIIGFTKAGDVIIRFSPELTQELSTGKTQSSFTWDEPGAASSTPPMPPPTSRGRSEGTPEESTSSWPGRARQTPASVTFASMGNEPSLGQQTGRRSRPMTAETYVASPKETPWASGAGTTRQDESVAKDTVSGHKK